MVQNLKQNMENKRKKINYFFFFHILEAADDPCFPNPCQNEGTCIANGADYTCNCQSGSKGEKCESKLKSAEYISCM
jgi:hypothetical protein